MAEAAARFKIAGKTYKLDPNLDKLSLRDIIGYDEEVAAAGLHATWGQTMQWAGEISALPEDDRMSHPRGFLVMAATVWASRRLSGEKVDFGVMLDDLDLGSIEWLESPVVAPKDHQPKKKSGSRKASVAATSSEAGDAPEPTTLPTSSEPSESALSA